MLENLKTHAPGKFRSVKFTAPNGCACRKGVSFERNETIILTSSPDAARWWLKMWRVPKGERQFLFVL